MLSLLGIVFHVLDWTQAKPTNAPPSLGGVFVVLVFIAVAWSGWCLAQVSLRRPLPRSQSQSAHTLSPTRLWLIVIVVGIALVTQLNVVWFGVRAANASAANAAVRSVHSHLAGGCASAALMASVVSFSLFQYWWQSFRTNPTAQP